MNPDLPTATAPATEPDLASGEGVHGEPWSTLTLAVLPRQLRDDHYLSGVVRTAAREARCWPYRAAVVPGPEGLTLTFAPAPN